MVSLAKEPSFGQSQSDFMMVAVGIQPNGWSSPKPPASRRDARPPMAANRAWFVGSDLKNHQCCPIFDSICHPAHLVSPGIGFVNTEKK